VQDATSFDSIASDSIASPAHLARPITLGVVLILALLNLGTLPLEAMPANHYAIVPVATAVMVAVWLAELRGTRWPRLLFVVLATAPNLWMVAIGHVTVNFLFLLLLVGWVTYTGTRGESLASLGLALATVGAAVLMDAADGAIAVSAWTSWVVGIVIIWLLSRLLNGQQRLLMELREAQAGLDTRAREIEALYQADEQLHGSLRLDRVLQALVDVGADILHADMAEIMVWDERREKLVVGAARGFAPESLAREWRPSIESLDDRVALTGEPVYIEEAPADPRVAHHITGPEQIRAMMRVPLVVGEQVFGVFGVSYTRAHTFSPEEKRLLVALGRRAALAIENAQLYEQAQQAATLAERQRLARELHDSVTQALYGMMLYTEAATRVLPSGDVDKVATYLHDLRDTAGEALREMRLLVFELRPPVLEKEGLVAALQARLDAVESRAGLATELDVTSLGILEPEIEQEMYRIAREALNNALKHARASRISVRLRQEDGLVTLDIADDGVGFDPTAAQGRGGLGLPGMRERVTRLGGTLTIESQPGEGTRVRVEVRP
jgi:signal transduction histidine kinase